jgi:hypothetical protein
LVERLTVNQNVTGSSPVERALWIVTLIGKRTVLKTVVGIKADGGSSPSLSSIYAEVMELVDLGDLESPVERRAGSSPVFGIINKV